MFSGVIRGASRDGWWNCLRCRRYFTKKPDEMFCFDCLKEMNHR